MERLGVGYETLAGVNPRLVYCSLSGYGPEGPYRERAGHDLNYVGLSGFLDLTGLQGGRPVIPGAPVADLMGALWAVVGIQFALMERERTGEGQRVDSSLLGGALSCLPLAWVRHGGGQSVERGASDLTGGVVCYQVYETQDGNYVTLAALEFRFWAAFCRAVGREKLMEEQYAPAVPGEPTYEALCSLFRERTRDEWAEALARVDACCEPVYSVGEALSSAPVEALGMLIDGGSGGCLPPIRLSAGAWRASSNAPGLGEHTTEVLAELGYAAGEVESWRGDGVV
jgi:crotonobetainyl-CoA:carnitine CoA-transferase CaiB-like acyl-CoA transferase